MSNAPRSASNTGKLDHLDTQALEVLGAGNPDVGVLVLTSDTELVDAVRRAAPGVAQVAQVANLNQIVRVQTDVKTGVFVLDLALAPNPTDTVARLAQQFPDVVIVAVGDRDTSATLMQLTAAGKIFRFILRPLSHGPTRLAIGAAIAQHFELRAKQAAAPQRVAHRDTQPKTVPIAIGAAVGVVAIGAIAWFVMKPTEAPVATDASAPRSTQPSELAGPSNPAQGDLALASEAFESGRYIEPRGESALDFYRSALALDPANETAAAGVTAVVEKILERAEAALVAGKLELAIQDIEVARDIDPSHSRLSFLDVQVQRERERVSLTQARDVGQRVSRLVGQARGELTAGRLIAPAGRNARDTLLQARALDPTNPAVVAGIRDLSAALTNAAREAVAAGNTERAQSYINAARSMGFAGAALAAVERSLAAARARPESAAPASQPAPTTTDPAATLADRRASAPASASATQPARATPAPAQPVPSQPSSNEVLQAATLPRTRQVAPEYPTQAAMNGVEGWVDIDFTISPQGVPQDLTVRDANPKRVFDRAAMNSVRQWRFEPIVENGTAVARRATLRVRFQLR